MLNRLVTSPDGVEWIVGRAFLFGPPRYIGFRFGRDRALFEPPRVRRVAVTARPPLSPTAAISRAPIRWSESESDTGSAVDRAATTHPRRGYRHRSGTIFLPVGPSGSSGTGSSARSGPGGGSGSGTSWTRSGGGGSRSFAAAGVAGTGSSFSRTSGDSAGSSGSSDSSGSSGSSGKGKGGGAVGGLAGLGALLVKVLKFALILIAIAIATWLTIFVLIPALIFGLWALLIALAIVRHAVFRQPWIVAARENRAAPRVQGWAVQGWRESQLVVDQVADAIAEGRDPQPLNATPVRID
ncbi:hypothetical protein [Nakamurella lactea]|uniref:hypothetical protein n=1 Tax=Nakamurella lactea TaxID=459515 RepID=UPI00041EB53B|nr:hypothetical protein [Nakamurella lactea]